MRAWFHFHAELNDFLASEQRDVVFEQAFGSTDTLKHVIESIGVPHTEIGWIEVNGTRADLATQARYSSVLNIFPPEKPVPLTNACFVADGHVGRLAAYLRMLGFDTWYERNADDPLLAAVSRDQNRLLLTRDVGLLKRRDVTKGYCVRSDKPHEQLREVVTRFGLRERISPFARCMDCNGQLLPVPKHEVEPLLPPHTRETKQEFSRCAVCGKIFWRGSHHTRMLHWIDALMK